MMDKRSKTMVLLGLAMLCSGCAREIADDRLTWLWGATPLVLFGLGGAVWVAWHRSRELARWDLRAQPLPPDGSSAVMTLVGLAAALGVAFVVLDLSAAAAAASQKAINLALWLFSSAIAVALAAFVGRRLAERGYSRGDK